jgi:hypothetical protein
MVLLRMARLAVLAVVVAGCSSEGTCHNWSIEHTLDGSLSSKSAHGELVTWAGHGDALALVSADEWIAETTTNPWFDGPSTAFVQLRMAGPGPYFRFVLPSHDGPQALGDLHAQLCENSADESADPVWQCVSLTGVLDVHAVSAPCADLSCGELDADLVLDVAAPSPGLASAASASSPGSTGTAHLHYAVVTTDYACREGFGKVPSFGLD